MAKNINHLQHVKSSVVEEGLPKLPQASVIVEGEIAVNYAKDYETLSIKNSSGEVVPFSSDYYYTEKYLGSGFTRDNSGLTVTQALNDTEQVIAAALNDLNERKLDASALTESLSGFVTTSEFNESELVTSAALNDLNSRIIEISGNTPEIDLSDYYTKTEVDDKLGSGFTGDNSGRTVTEIIEENELITAAALTDLDSRKLDASAYTQSEGITSVTINGDTKQDNVSFTNIASGATMNGISKSVTASGILELGNVATSVTVNGSTKSVDNNGQVALGNLASAITVNGSTNTVAANGQIALGTVVSAATLNNSAQTITNGTLQMSLSANYDSNEKKIYLKSGSATISEIDATDFIKDGMVNNVDVSGVTSGATEVECLVISFNTDAGKQNINIPISKLFDSSLYYTKTEIDNKLGSGFTGDNSGLTVTQALNDTEQVIAASLNDLNNRKLDASALTETLSGFVTTSEFDESELVTSAALNDLNSRKLDASALTEVTDYVDEKLGEWFSGDTTSATFKSVTQVIREDEQAISASLNDLNSRINTISAETSSIDLTQYYTKEEIDDSELVIASSLNDLNSRKLDASAYTPTDLSEYATMDWVNNERLGSAFTESSVTQVLYEDELIISAALTDLDDRVSANTLTIQQVNAKADNTAAALSGYTPSGYSYSKTETDNKLATKLDTSAFTQSVSGFVTTEEFDEKLGSGFTGDNSGLTVTQAIEENELAIAAALNDLDSRIKNVSSVTESIDLSQYYTKTDVNNALGSAFTPSNYVSSVTDVVKENELIVSSALNDLNSRVLTLENIDNTYVSAGTYDSANSKIVIYQAHGPIVEITGVTAGGGSSSGDVNVIESVKINGTALTPDANKAVDITSVPSSIVTQDATHRFVSDTEKSAWNAVTSKTDTTAFTAHTGDSTVHVTSTEKSTWNGKQDAISDLASIRTSAATQSDWNATSGVAQILNKPTIPTNLNQLTSAHTHAISEVTNLQTTLNAKVSGITVNSEDKVTPTNGVANLTINALTVGALPTGTTLDDVADGSTRKLSNYSLTSHTHDEYATTGTVNTLNNTVTAHTANTEIHVTAANKTSWDNAVTSAHSHSNNTVLDNLTQGVINNSHTHNNKTVLDGITTAKTASWNTVTAKTDNSSFTAHTADTTVHVTTANKTQWNNAISGVSFNGATATVSNHVAAITATIPAAPGTLTTTATTAQATATNQSLSGNIALHKVSKTGSYNDLNDKPTIPAAANNATITLQFGNSSSAFTVNASSNLTINLATLIGIPAPTASDNGKILGVVNGQLAWVTPTTIYTGSGTPSSGTGNDGDIYLQTS